MQEQQQLMQLNEQTRVTLMEQEQVAMRKVLNNLEVYMKDHYTGKVKYVLGRAAGGGILYAEHSLNITRAVIKGLNKEYKDSIQQ
jgi:outer membrane protein